MLNEKGLKILEDTLREAGVDGEEIYQRCADLCMAGSDAVQALHFYFLAGADEMLLRMFEQEGGSEYYDRAPEVTKGLFLRCTMEQKLRHPVAYLNFLQNRVIHDPTYQTIRLLDEFAKLLKEKEALETWAEAELLLIKSFLAFNQRRAMARIHQRAAQLLAGRHSRVFSREMVFTFGAGQLLALYHRAPGELDALPQDMRELTECFVQVSGGCGAGGAELALAELHLERGSHAACNEQIERALSRARWHGQNSIQIAAYFLRARLALAQGDQSAFETAMRQMEETPRKNPLEDAEMELASAYLTTAADEGAACPAWIEVCDPEGGYLLPFAHGWRDIVFGRVLLRRGRYLELESLSETMLLRGRDPAHAAAKQLYVTLYAKLFGAAARAHSRPQSARALWEQAVALAAPDGITTPFLELAGEALPFLRQSGQDGFEAELYRLCAKRAETDRRRKRLRAHAPSPRELAVLELMAAGWKRPDIAEKLGVSQNTVRKHVDNLYHKLGVHDRAEAIAWLRRSRGG